MDDKTRKLIKEIRFIANNMPKGHRWKRRKGDTHRKIWGMPTRRRKK